MNFNHEDILSSSNYESSSSESEGEDKDDDDIDVDETKSMSVTDEKYCKIFDIEEKELIIKRMLVY